MGEKRGAMAASSFLYKLMESFGMQGVSFVVSIVLARLLDIADYGVITMLTIFIAISQVFVQSGLNTALIQKKEVDDTDLSSAFYVSLGIASVLYGTLFFCAPLIATFFDSPVLTSALRVLALILFPGAMLSIQNAVVARQMQFRKLMLLSLTSTVVSGAVGIGMAYAGFGHWALVAQQLTNQTVLACLLFWQIDFRPKLLFHTKRVLELLSFGWKLLAPSLLETGYNNLRSLVIAKQFGDVAVGYYHRGKQFPELLMNAVNGSIQGVMLPVLSEKQDDTLRMKQMMRRSVMVSSFLVLPAMAGLAGVATPLVTLLLTEKWLVCVPFLQICCIDFAFYPIHTANLQAINALGRSDVFLKLEVIKKSFGILVLTVSVLCFDTIDAIAWGAVISTLVAAFVNSHPNRKLLGYGYLEQMKDVLPSMMLALCMFGVVSLVGLIAIHPLFLLALQVMVGVIFYAGVACVLRMESFVYLLTKGKQMLKRGTT